METLLSPKFHILKIKIAKEPFLEHLRFYCFICFMLVELTTNRLIGPQTTEAILSADPIGDHRHPTKEDHPERYPTLLGVLGMSQLPTPDNIQTSPTMGGTECQDGIGANSPSGEKKSVISCAPP